MASLGYVPGLAAGRATVSRSCADLRGIAVHYLVTGAAGADTFFAAVLPKADTHEATDEVTVVVGAAQAVIAARCRGPYCPGFTDRTTAIRIDARFAGCATPSVRPTRSGNTAAVSFDASASA